MKIQKKNNNSKYFEKVQAAGVALNKHTFAEKHN